MYPFSPDCLQDYPQHHQSCPSGLAAEIAAFQSRLAMCYANKCEREMRVLGELVPEGNSIRVCQSLEMQQNGKDLGSACSLIIGVGELETVLVLKFCSSIC